MKFNITRLGLLLKRHFLVSGRKYLTGIAIGTGVIVMITVATLLFGGTAQISQFNQYALFAYFIGGLIVSSMAFTEINKPETGYQMMTLPASSLEKFVSTWLFTSIIYTILAFVVITLAATLLYLFGQLGLSIRGDAFSLHEMGDSFKQYFVGNIIFLAGAAAFKRNAFFKTMLSFVVVFAFLVIYSLVLVKVFGFTDLASGNSSGMGFALNGSSFNGMFSNSESASVIAKTFLAVFFLVLGFFKFKEREL
jgi:hypothetical protein